jgi:mono/diheme cytochrome c family protein
VLDVLRLGMPGTSMPAYDQLSEQQLGRLADETLRLRKEGLREQFVQMLAQYGEEPDPDEVRDFLEVRTTARDLVQPPAIRTVTAQSIARGKQLYLDQGCAQCHAEDGRGAADTLLYTDLGQPIRPRDLTCEPFKGGQQPRSVFVRLQVGMPGTPHPATTGLSSDQIVDLTHYTLSLGGQPLRQLTNHQRAIYAATPAYLAALRDRQPASRLSAERR